MHKNLRKCCSEKRINEDNKKPLIAIFILMVVVSVGMSIASTAQALIAKKLIDAAVALNSKEAFKFIFILGGIIIAVLVFDFANKRLFAISDKKLTDSLRSGQINNYLDLEFSSHRRHTKEEYVSLINNDAKPVVDEYYLLLVSIFFFIFSIIILTIALVWIYPLLALIVIVTNTLPIIVPLIFKKKLERLKKEAFEELGSYNIKLTQTVVGFSATRYTKLKRLYKVFIILHRGNL